MFQHKSPTKTLRRGTCPLGARLTGTGSASTCLGGLRLRCCCCRVTLQGRKRGEQAAPLLPQEQAAEPGPCSGCQGWEDLWEHSYQRGAPSASQIAAFARPHLEEI